MVDSTLKNNKLNQSFEESVIERVYDSISDCSDLSEVGYTIKRR